MSIPIQWRRGVASNWSSTNPVLAEGEVGLELDTGRIKAGNGVDHWNDLDYSIGATGAQGPQGNVVYLEPDEPEEPFLVPGPQGQPGTTGTQGLPGLPVCVEPEQPEDQLIFLKSTDVGVESSILRNLLSSGLISGGILSINVDPQLFDITAGSGIVVDNYTDPENPTYTRVTWPNRTAQSALYRTTNTWESIGIDVNGDFVFKADDMFDEDEKRDLIIVGWVTHEDLDILDSAYTEPIWFPDSLMKVDDFLDAYGSFNIEGNDYGPTGDLEIYKTEGVTFSRGFNYVNSKQNPNMLTSPAEDPVTFWYYYQSSPGVWVNDNPEVTDVDPNNYDSGSGLVAVTAGYWTIQPISIYALMDATDVQYGQAEYASLLAAKVAMRDQIVINPYNQWDTFRCWLIVKQGATDLTDPAQALFVSPPRMPMSDLATGGVGLSPVVTDHNDLENIQGGQADERYHLDVAQYNDITAGSYQYTSLMSDYQSAGAYLTTQTVQTQNILNAASLSGNNTSGVLAAISSGTIYLAGGNNVTLSQDGNSLTISAFTQSLQAAVLSMNGSSGQLSVSGSRNVTVENNASTISVYGPANILNSFSIGGNTGTTGSSAVSGGGFIIAGGNNITLSQSNNTISIIGGAGAAGGAAIQGSGTYTQNTGTVQFQNSNGLTFGLSSDGVMTAAHNGLTTAAASNHTHSDLYVNTSVTSSFQLMANSTLSLGTGAAASFVYTSQSSLLQHTSATSAITASAMNTSERAALQYTSANTKFMQGWELEGAQTAGTTSSSQGTQLYLSGGNNITLSGNSNTIVISMNPASLLNTSQSSLFQHTSATSAITANAMNTSERVNYFYTSNNTFANSTHSHGNPTLALTNLTGTTASASNGLTLSLSAAAPGAAAENNWVNISGNTAGSTTASGSTVNWVGGNNITLSCLNNSQVRIDAAAGGGGITYPQFEPFAINNTGTIQSQATLFIAPISVDQYVTATRADLIVSIAQSVNATKSHLHTLSAAVIVYTLSNDSIRLQTVSSGSQSYAFSIGSGSSTNSVSFTGYRAVTVPININMTPGLYWIGMWSMTTTGGSASSSNNDMKATMQGVAPRVTGWYANGMSVSNNSASTTCIQMPGNGYVTVSRAATNLSSILFIARSTSAGGTTNASVSFASRVPYVMLRNFSFPMMSN